MTPITCAAVLSALLLQVLAQPQHAHHRHMHKRVDFNNPDLYKNVDWSKVFGTDSQVHGATVAAAPAAAPGINVGGDLLDGASNLLSAFGGRTSPWDNGNVDMYKGNCGIPWGSNIIKIAANKVKDFKYTVQFKNNEQKAINIVVWNKSGPDGQSNSGQYSKPALSFKLAPGKTQFVAFDENSQVAWCRDTGKRTQWGAYDCTYGEADFGNASNQEWSGADVSSIQNTAGNVETMKIECSNGQVSTNLANGYTSDKQLGGIGCNVSPGKFSLVSTWG